MVILGIKSCPTPNVLKLVFLFIRGDAMFRLRDSLKTSSVVTWAARLRDGMAHTERKIILINVRAPRVPYEQL